MAQVLTHLPNKGRTLTLNLSTAKKKKKKETWGHTPQSLAPSHLLCSSSDWCLELSPTLEGNKLLPLVLPTIILFHFPSKRM
jgi:hypothetical protein